MSLAPKRLTQQQNDQQLISLWNRDQSIRQHFIDHRFSVHVIDPLKKSPLPRKTARCQDLLAIANSVMVILYDLKERSQLWSCPMKLREGHDLNALQVSPEGQVIAVSGFDHNTVRDGYVFSQGKFLGSFDLRPCYIKRMDMVNGLFFALSPAMKEIYVGDRDGKGISTIANESFAHNRGKFVLWNAWYYVLVANPLPNENSPAKVFMYELEDNRSNVFQLPAGKILAADLYSCILTCAFQNRIIQVTLAHLFDYQKEYPHPWNFGSQVSLLSNDRYLIVADPDDTNALWSVKSKERTCLYKDLIERPQLSFSGFSLFACFKNEDWHHVVLFDLETSTPLKHISYAFFPGDDLSLINGKLVIANNTETAIYVEDYENTSTKKTGRHSDPRKKISTHI